MVNYFTSTIETKKFSLLAGQLATETKTKTKVLLVAIATKNKSNMKYQHSY